MSIHRYKRDGAGDDSSPGNSSPENVIRYSQSVEPPNLEATENNPSKIVKPKPDKVGLLKQFQKPSNFENNREVIQNG